MFLPLDTIEGFAVKRSPTLSFPYLKENGELLSIAYHSGLLVEPRALDLYSEFYDKSFSILQCYPQYYRFIMGLILDLEALGYDGNKGHQISKFVREEAFINFDTSDCRRLEVISLLSRKENLDQTHENWQTQIMENTNLFLQNSRHFTKFSKPLFYDLTHTIFFVTDYGNKVTSLNDQFITTLTYIGILSLLDHDADLLAEICICLQYLGAKPPQYWTDYLIKSNASVEVLYDQSVKSHLNSSVDEYHLYLVLNWYAASEGHNVFTERFKSRTPNFVCPSKAKTPLSYLSDANHKCVINKTKKKICFTDFLNSLPEDDQTHVTNVMGSSSKSQMVLFENANRNIDF